MIDVVVLVLESKGVYYLEIVWNVCLCIQVRLLYHGRLQMAINEWYWYFSASRNPYDVTERMQWEWRQASFDWTNGMVLWVHEQDMRMLDARLRTVSFFFL